MRIPRRTTAAATTVVGVASVILHLVTRPHYPALFTLLLLRHTKITTSSANNENVENAKDHVGGIRPKVVEINEQAESLGTQVVVVADVVFPRSVQHLSEERKE